MSIFRCGNGPPQVGAVTFYEDRITHMRLIEHYDPGHHIVFDIHVNWNHKLVGYLASQGALPLNQRLYTTRVAHARQISYIQEAPSVIGRVEIGRSNDPYT